MTTGNKQHLYGLLCLETALKCSAPLIGKKKKTFLMLITGYYWSDWYDLPVDQVEWVFFAGILIFSGTCLMIESEGTQIHKQNTPSNAVQMLFIQDVFYIIVINILVICNCWIGYKLWLLFPQKCMFYTHTFSLFWHFWHYSMSEDMTLKS